MHDAARAARRSRRREVRAHLAQRSDPCIAGSRSCAPGDDRLGHALRPLGHPEAVRRRPGRTGEAEPAPQRSTGPARLARRRHHPRARARRAVQGPRDRRALPVDARADGRLRRRDPHRSARRRRVAPDGACAVGRDPGRVRRQRRSLDRSPGVRRLDDRCAARAPGHARSASSSTCVSRSSLARATTSGCPCRRV